MITGIVNGDREAMVRVIVYGHRGDDKRTQDRDIANAIELARET